MTILFVLLLNTFVTGLDFHEIAGLIILGLFIIHNLLNWRWIVGITKNLFNGKSKAKTIIIYIVDFLLMICMVLTVLSGIFISKVLFTSLVVSNVEFWSYIHKPIAYVCLILISIHLGLHWKYIMASFKKMLNLKEVSKGRTLVSRLFALVIVIAGIRSSIVNDLAGNIIVSQTPATFAEKTEIPHEEHTETTVNKERKYQSKETVSPTTTVTTDSKTLDQHLGSLYCTGCSKHCSLLYPQCSIGVRQAEEATVTYNTTIAKAVATDTAMTATVTPTASSSTTTATSETTNSTTSITQSNLVLTTDSIFDPFIDYVPIMGVWIAGVHYLVVAAERKKKNDKGTNEIDS